MNKKLLNLRIVSVLLASTFLVTGCGNNSTDTPSYVPEIIDSISLSEESIELVLGDTYKLQPKVSSTRSESLPVIYKSSDSSVVTVDEDGNLTSLKVGRSIIELSYGKASTKVTVSVTLGDYRPYIRFENIFTDEITVDLGTTIDVSAYVFFNSNKYYPDLGYELSNLSAGSVDENHKYTPNKVGKYKVTVCGSFNNYNLEDLSLTINVVNNVEFSVTRKGDVQELSNISLCTLSSFNENVYQNELEIEAYAIDQGVRKPLNSISLVDNDEGAISFDSASMKVKATGVGKGNASLLLSYTNSKGEVTTQKFPVYVDYPVVPYSSNEPIYEVGVKNGTFDGESIFASFPVDQRKVTEARSADGKTSYQVDGTGKISGLVENISEIQTMLIGNGKILQEVKYIAYAGVITKAEDLNMFNTASKDGNYRDILNLKITGKYVVLNDIDATGFELDNHDRIAGEGLYAFKTCGFLGEFDGRGHTISNLTFRKGGIFSAIGGGAIVHNIGFENAKFDSISYEDRHILATYINSATIENLYVHIDKLATRVNASGLICHDMDIYSSFTNSLIIADEANLVSTDLNGYGLFSSYGNPRKQYGSASADYFKDTYFVGNAPLVRSQLYTNVKLSNAYYCDTADINWDMSYHFKGVDDDGLTVDTYYDVPKYTVPNAKHYLSLEDYKSANNDYSSFNEDYWKVTEQGLTWKV